MKEGVRGKRRKKGWKKGSKEGVREKGKKE